MHFSNISMRIKIVPQWELSVFFHVWVSFAKHNLDGIISHIFKKLIPWFYCRMSNSIVSLVDTESTRFLCLFDLLSLPVKNFNIFHISDLPVSVIKQYRIGSATQFKLVNATVIL